MRCTRSSAEMEMERKAILRVPYAASKTGPYIRNLACVRATRTSSSAIGQYTIRKLRSQDRREKREGRAGKAGRSNR